jgi:hypothetical protein
MWLSTIINVLSVAGAANPKGPQVVEFFFRQNPGGVVGISQNVILSMVPT